MRTHRPLRITALGIVTALCALIAVVAGSLLLTQVSHRSAKPPETAGAPQGVGPNGEIIIGNDETVAVDYYFDYFCETCPSVDESVMAAVRSMEQAGYAHIRYHPMSVLDGSEPNADYSSRTAGAAYCVANSRPTAFTRFHLYLMAAQPPGRNPGLTNSQITDFAADAGGADTVPVCVSEGAFEPYVREMTARARKEGVVEMPSIMVAGDEVPEELRTPEAVRTLILREAGVLGPEVTPTVAPEPTGRRARIPR